MFRTPAAEFESWKPILDTDENSFDPNRYEEYNTREWKRSQVWDRKN